MKRPLAAMSGFTIIEVMLFLSISGLMMVGILAVVSGTIERQRYTDVTQSTVDYLKGQYNYTANTHNNRSSDSGCAGGSVSLQAGANSTARGTSNCYIVGRIVRSNDDANRLISHPVLATRDSTAAEVATATGEAETIEAMGLLIDDATNPSEHTMAYNTYLTPPGNSGNRLPFSMLVVRLPESNLLRTYFVSGPGAQNRSLSEIVNQSGDSILCIESDGLMGSTKNGAQISVGISGSLAVQFAPGDACS